MKEVFARCFKKTAVQVCTVIIMELSSCNIVYSLILLQTPCIQGIWLLVLISVYFSQVKNKPWLPWVYSWIWHRREQLQKTKIKQLQWNKNKIISDNLDITICHRQEYWTVCLDSWFLLHCWNPVCCFEVHLYSDHLSKFVSENCMAD